MKEIIKNNQKNKGLCATKYQSLFDRHGVPFTFEELELLVMNPLNVEKSQAFLIHPSSSRGKTKDIIKKHNLFSWLWVDLDSGNKTLSEVINICKTYQITNAVIYSTASACREKKGVQQGYRWRIVILPNRSLSCDDWQTMQVALSRIFESGAEACKLSQGFFAPSNCDGGFYEYALL
ncbi:MAG: hypothetical protein PHY09_08130 [Desulfuromonadaceae bacterium]|nr:hypothetical protein [Desulfuromonadaceae bacterium]MDD5106291.1 hypothetical protein [Desulfuromonadaceae bacterium]